MFQIRFDTILENSFSLLKVLCLLAHIGTSSPYGVLKHQVQTKAPGLFQRSGNWNGSFNNQGSNGNYWSSSQYSATVARSLSFSSTGVRPAYNFYKSNGFAVRCIAE